MKIYSTYNDIIGTYYRYCQSSIQSSDKDEYILIYQLFKHVNLNVFYAKKIMKSHYIYYIYIYSYKTLSYLYLKKINLYLNCAHKLSIFILIKDISSLNVTYY